MCFLKITKSLHKVCDLVCVLRTHVAQMEVQSYLLLVLIVSLKKIFMPDTATSVGVKRYNPS